MIDQISMLCFSSLSIINTVDLLSVSNKMKKDKEIKALDLGPGC